jgi:hypothetical protein
MYTFSRPLTVHSKTPKSNDIQIVGMESAKKLGGFLQKLRNGFAMFVVCAM